VSTAVCCVCAVDNGIIRRVGPVCALTFWQKTLTFLYRGVYFMTQIDLQQAIQCFPALAELAATITPCRVRWLRPPNWPTNEKTPQRAKRGALRAEAGVTGVGGVVRRAVAGRTADRSRVPRSHRCQTSRCGGGGCGSNPISPAVWNQPPAADSMAKRTTWPVIRS